MTIFADCSMLVVEVANFWSPFRHGKSGAGLCLRDWGIAGSPVEMDQPPSPGGCWRLDKFMHQESMRATVAAVMAHRFGQACRFPTSLPDCIEGIIRISVRNLEDGIQDSEVRELKLVLSSGLKPRLDLCGCEGDIEK